MKTAMQELKEYLESKEYNYMNAALMEFALDINKKATELLKKEQEQILDAFNVGQANWDPKCRTYENGNHYHNYLYD